MFSDAKLSAIQEALLPALEEFGGKYTVAVAGSLGRKEAHPASDIDAFVLCDSKGEEKAAEAILTDFQEIAKDIGLKMAAKGAFSTESSIDEILAYIGGNQDTNNNLTRRMLILVEGVGISTGENSFKKAKKAILDKYLKQLQSSLDKRPVFLINDLIRYYRTMCVDYEYKKTDAGKRWAVRLTKLRHSRKLLYFSALLPLLESLNVNPDVRISWLEEQFGNNTPLERIAYLLEKYAEPEHWQILIKYDQFLKFMTDEKRRESLDSISFDDRHRNSEYEFVRTNAQEFRRALNDFVLHVPHWQEPIAKYVLS